MKGLGKYTIPIIGVLSSGKSTFINGLFLNKTLLEVGMAHTTKFICIIRHQPELPDGKYRFTKVKIEPNALIKDGETIEDEVEIKKKITEINTKEVVSEDILNDFYLLELNIHLIDDKKANDELLKDVDFMDIPGLDFFEAQKKDKNEIETKKISNLFKNFKDKLKYFMIVFDCLRLQHDTGFTILEKLKKEFNIKMENNLIVINKINLMPEKTVDEIKEYFIEELLKKPDIINHNKNVVLPLNAEKILLQQQYKMNFSLFVKYLFYLFCEYTLKKGKSEDNLFLNYIMDFIDHKKEELNISEIDISKIVNYKEEIVPAFKQIYTNDYHTEQIKYVEKEKEEDFFNDLNKDTFCELYYLYSNNLIEYDLIEYKKAKQEIIIYLQMIEQNKEDEKEKDKDNVKEKKSDNLLFIEKLDELIKSNIIELSNKEFEEILKEINKRKNLIVNALLNTQFRISVVGLSSAGKSYIINCLIGKKILKEGSGETTKFGLIIENHDSDEVSLCRAKYKYISDEKGNEYCIFEKDDTSFVSGFDNVKKHLLLLNKNSITQERDKIKDKEFLFRFWILKIRIAMCQFKNLKIQIIDFPGLGTSLKYIETDIFRNLLSTSNIIFHVLDFDKTGEPDREISEEINKYVNDFRLDPYFAHKNTLYILNKLNPSTKNDEKKNKEKLAEIFSYKKESIFFIGINNKFYEDLIEVTNSTFSEYLKKYYDKYKRRYKSKYSDFVKFFNSYNKINDNEEKILTLDGNNIINEQIIKDKAIEEFQYFLSKGDKNEYEKIIFDFINTNENFKNNVLYFYTNEKIKLDKNGTLKKIDDLNNFIILRFGSYRNYFKKIIEGFISYINKLLFNILNSRSIPKEDLEKIKNDFKIEIEGKYKMLIEWYSKHHSELIKKVGDKLEELKKIRYKNILSIDKSKIKDDIQKFIKEIVKSYNESNKDSFKLIIQTQLYEILKNIIHNYEEQKNKSQKGKKMEFNEFKDFIKNNIKIIENENIDLENVDTEDDECCGYSEEKKNEYLDKKFEKEKSKLQKYFDILIKNTEKQKNQYIKDYLEKLNTSFGEYNEEEKKNIKLIETQINYIINGIFHGISDYHLYVEESAETSDNIFKNEIQKTTPSDEGFGFKKLDIFIYPGKDINLRGISIKIKKEFNPDYSTPFISIAFPSKNIHLFEKITSYLLEFEKSRKEKIFIIGKEKNLEKITMKINFIKNFKYFNWIEKFSDVFDKFSLFKFEFLTPIMFNQPIDNKAAYDILKSFLLIQMQGDIPVITFFEFLRVENIVTTILTQLMPKYMGALLKALTSITFELNTSFEEIPFETFVKNEFMQFGFLKISFMKLVEALFGIPNALLDCEDVEINFRLFKNNLNILLNLPVQHSYLLENN